MYIDKLCDENIGPIDKVNIKFPFYENGDPKPIIFVGKNGSGKSTLLSNIVDSLYDIAGAKFENAKQLNGEGRGFQYYKAIIPAEIKVGKSYLYSCIVYKCERPIYYIFKSGTLSVSDFKSKVSNSNQISINWQDTDNYKHVTATKEDAKNIFETDAICYFGPDRYEKPMWMGEKYFSYDDYLHPTIKENWNGILKNPISVKNVTEVSLQWLMDVIVDSRPDVEGPANNLRLANVNPATLMAMRKARQNLETILSKIVGKDVYFSLNFRNYGPSRFKIVERATDEVLAPTLDSLSTGQIALFNMFSTIVRYGDTNDMNKSISLKDISGIVVIDEIELHLHTSLQKEVLPELIKLFPKVQFIITSHAPLFLLGMQEKFGKDGYEVYEMPEGKSITAEEYSEFSHAYDSMMKTRKAQEEREVLVANTIEQLKGLLTLNSKALIITEGCSDWKHMARAWEKLKAEFPAITDKFEFLQFGPDGDEDATLKLEMGVSNLVGMCKQYAKLPQQRKLIFISDSDAPNESKILTCAGKEYKDWGNNVYSFEIPTPEFRKNVGSGICIEHYYTDDEIKTEMNIDGVQRRLYLANEFSARMGNSADKSLHFEGFHKCNRNKNPYTIIEGDKGNCVGRIDEEEEYKTNLCLSKNDFASAVYHEVVPFNEISSDNFRLIFNVLSKILC